MLRYFAGLERVPFSENQPKYTEVSNFAFILPRHQLQFVMNAFASRSTSVGELQKCAARAKLFVC